MDRRELEIMLNDAFDRGIVTARAVEGIYPPAVTVGILDDLGREIDFGHEGSGLTVFLPGIEDDARFAGSCKALGGKVPQNTYRMELVSAIAGELMGAESATALSALESALDRHALGTYRMVDGYCIMGGLDEVPLADAYAVDAALIEDWGVGDAVFRITDLKAKTFSYAVDADGGQKASTLVYYTDEGSDPVLFQQTGGGWRLASDNFLAENSIVEDLERVYTGEVSPVYLDSRIVDMEEMAEAYGWVRPEKTPASIAAVARKAAASSAAEKPSPGKVADAAREVSKGSAPRH